MNTSLYQKGNILYSIDNHIVFDFKTDNKGFINLNTDKSLTIIHLRNIEDDLGNVFSLFEFSDVNNYFGEQLNLIIVCSLKYGVVAEFLTNSSNKFQFNYKGYIGIKPVIDNLFIEKKIL